MKRQNNSYHKEIAYALSLLTQIGVTMIVTIGIGIFTGRFLDNLLNTSPIFLIIMIVISVIAAFKNLYLLTAKTWKETDKHDD